MARDDRSGEYTVVLGFFIAICTLLVLLRCYTKLVIVKNFAADDYFSVLTLVGIIRIRTVRSTLTIFLGFVPGFLYHSSAGRCKWYREKTIPHP